MSNKPKPKRSVKAKPKIKDKPQAQTRGIRPGAVRIKPGNKQATIDWLKLRERYKTSDDFPTLLKIHNELKSAGTPIHYSTLKQRSANENWPQQRKEYWNRVEQKKDQKLINEEVDRISKFKNFVMGSIVEIIRQIKNKEIKGSFGELDRLIRLYEYLEGNPDSRPGGSSGIESFLKELAKNRVLALNDYKKNLPTAFIDIPAEQVTVKQEEPKDEETDCRENG